MRRGENAGRYGVRGKRTTPFGWLPGWITLIVALAAGAGAMAGPADTPPAERRESGFPPVFETCDAQTVIAEIMRIFSERERAYWSSSLEITGFDKIAETGYRTNGLSYIPRRYCRAEALFNDGQRRRVIYNIGSQNGFIGAGPGIIWCVEGLDREHAYGPNCRAAGP